MATTAVKEKTGSMKAQQRLREGGNTHGYYRS